MSHPYKIIINEWIWKVVLEICWWNKYIFAFWKIIYINGLQRLRLCLIIERHSFILCIGASSWVLEVIVVLMPTDQLSWILLFYFCFVIQYVVGSSFVSLLVYISVQNQLFSFYFFLYGSLYIRLSFDSFVSYLFQSTNP